MSEAPLLVSCSLEVLPFFRPSPSGASRGCVARENRPQMCHSSFQIIRPRICQPSPTESGKIHIPSMSTYILHYIVYMWKYNRPTTWLCLRSIYHICRLAGIGKDRLYMHVNIVYAYTSKSPYFHMLKVYAVSCVC